MLNKETKKILKEAGWYAGRKINIDKYIVYYKTSEEVIYESVKKFLEEFGCLNIQASWEIKMLNGEKMVFENETIINPIFALEPYSLYAPIEMEIEAGEAILIVGVTRSSEYKVAISESGKVYCDRGLLGNDFYEAMNTLCSYRLEGIIDFE